MRLHRRVPPVVAIVVGVAIIVGALVAWHGNRSAPGAFGGEQPSTSASRSAPRAAAPTPAKPTSAPSKPDGSAASPAPLVILPLPARLNLPSLRVQAPVTEVETTDGILGVPQDPATVGWWTGSAPPGAGAGSTVIDGHVDSAETGLGALFHLSELANGDLVSITAIDGTELRYQVYGRRVYVKHQGLPADLFASGGPARLVLITCGGPFDSSTRSYLDNVVVFARPVLG